MPAPPAVNFKRSLRCLLTLACLLILAGCQKAQRAAEYWSVEQIPDVAYGHANGKPLLLDIALPKQKPPEKMPVIVFFHGGAFRYGTRKTNYNLMLAARGYFTVNVDYRLSGTAKWPAQIEDAKAAVRWVRANADKYHLDIGRIGVWGLSAGGYLATMVGLTADTNKFDGKSGNPGYSSRVACVADVFGPTDLSQLTDQPDMLTFLFGKTLTYDPGLAHLVNPATYATPGDPPFLILHGEQDTLVPFAQSELLVNALEKATVPVTFLPVPGMGHNDGILQLPPVRAALFAFFDAHLKGTKKNPLPVSQRPSE